MISFLQTQQRILFFVILSLVSFKPPPLSPPIMIVTKQRKSLQPSSPYTRGQKYRYTNDDHDGLLRDYHPSGQSVPINYGQRERHSISTVSPIPKGRQNCFNSYSKKTQKKYDYSLNLDLEVENQQMNRTHDHVNEKYRYEPEPRGQMFKGDFVLQNFDKRRIASVNQTASKYLSAETKSRGVSKQFQYEPMKSTLPQQKIDIKTYLRNYEPQYDSGQKPQQKKINLKSTKEIEPFTKKPLMSQNFMQDNFGVTDKFKQFKNHTRSKQNQDPKTRSKYESKYAGMRNNKRYEITKEEPKMQRSSAKQNDKEKFIPEKPIDVQNLLKDSSTQNKNIVEKINRIQKLNQEINRRLESMMQRKQDS